MTIKRIKNFVLNKEWAVTLAIALGAVTALQEQLVILPDGDAKNWIMGAVVAAGGFLTRLRVWSLAAVDVATGAAA
jgi:hypothetical protein